MGLLDNYTGLGMSPRPTADHQRILFKLSVGIYTDLAKGYEVLTESCLDVTDLNSKAPDVVLYKKKGKKLTPILFIEVTTTNMVKQIIEASKEACKQYSTVEEAFVYDYQKKNWFWIVGTEVEKVSYCPLLGEDLKNYLK